MCHHYDVRDRIERPATASEDAADDAAPEDATEAEDGTLAGD